MKRFSKIISVLLAVLMVASAVSIGAILSYHLPQEDESKLDGNNIIISEEEREELPAKEERNDELLDMENKNPVPDSELIVPVEDNPVSAENMNADAPETSEKTEVDVSIYYDDNNNIKVPFDEIYPEEFEEGVFEYDDETLMFKVRTLNEKREEKLKEAGILKTEEMMVLEDAVWYIGYIEKDADITAVMEEVRALDFIKVAEYNFKYEAASSEVVASGKCGANLTWELDSAGTLTVSGTGDMYDNYQWSGNKDSFKTLVIENGITSIGEYAFSYCNFTGDLIIPGSVKEIKTAAFLSCKGFDGKLVLSEGVESIGNLAFSKCHGLDEKIEIPASVKSIGQSAFDISIEEAYRHDMNFYFKGDAPSIHPMGSGSSLGLDDYGFECTVYYPAGNDTWEIVDGKWNGYTAVSYGEEEGGDSDPATGTEENPKYKDQWYLDKAGIKKAWEYEKENDLPMAGEGTIVAVIDTGVDFDHIDLKSNMWKNVNEIPDNGMDDDGNGYVDDYYGIDIVYGSGNGDDDHGHGTHVAGIIAAANNKEGIVGIAYNSKIMAVKAGQASGYFLQSDIAKAIIYAWQNGADVINMSFGGTASSIAVQDALTAAYTDCILVASAGNDGMHNEPVPGLLPPKPNYPAAFKYVLGVMSVNQSGVESGFTNWDVKAYTTVEYEVYAPGEQIWSTIPNDRYAAWSGTSMAAPVVSAAAANLRAAFGDRDTYPTKFIYAQLASTSEVSAYCLNPEKHGPHNLPMVANAYSALTVMPKPEVDVLDFNIFDTEKYGENNNGDGVIDAGETFELGFTLRNRWGMAENAVITIDSISEAGIANKYITFDGGESSSKNYGSIGTYSDKDAGKIYDNDMHVGWENPFMLSVTSDCPNDYIIKINYTLTYENALDTNDETVYETTGTIEIIVRRGVLVPNDISEDMTLTADKYWIVPYSVLIREGATVTVEAGTRIQFYCSDANDPYAETGAPYIEVAGTLLFDGTEENHIEIFPSELYGEYGVQIYKSGSGYISMKYCDVVNPLLGGLYDNTPDKHITNIERCVFTQNFVDAPLYRSYLSGGNVHKDNSNIKIYAVNIVESAFNDIARESDYWKLDVCGNVENCIFESCNILMNNYYGNDKVTNSTFRNCKGNIDISNLYQSHKATRVDSESVLFNSPYFYKNIDTYMLDFIIAMGAELYCFDTKEDINADWLNDNYGYMIGLYKDYENDEYRWIDGSIVDDSIKEIIVEGNKKFGMIYGGKIHFDYDTFGNFVYCYFNDVNNMIPDSLDLFNMAFHKWIYNEKDYPSYSGNVMLNNPNSSVSEWLKINSFNDSKHEYSLSLNNNYWGTTNPELIEKQITDFDDDVSLAQIKPGNFLTEAPENVWPFVVDAGTIVDGEEFPIVGNEEVTFFVEFNRDMDTTIPLRVRFGSYYPYADYEVPGEYVSPRRWEGTMTLTTLIENGTQYFNISNGKAADSFQKLYEDWGRFTFEIDTTEALAMNLQAVATDEGIQLNWFQDDFDTLMGYNVYRSTEEDGYYQKLNDMIIPTDTKEFFDDEVEPGTLYYYNFTVVKTDLTESVPSGKQVIMSKDTMLPDVYHTPVYNAFTGNKVTVSATVTDNLMVDSVKLYYRIAGTEEWESANMGRTNDKFFHSIDQSFVTTAGIEYYIEAFDGTGYAYKGSAEEPYFITVQVAVSDNDKGDVDGDGVITNRDALILLQGINDLYNLSLEEFARADINGDGELNAVEALRILQYVSGKITSVLF